eukprot:403362259
MLQTSVCDSSVKYFPVIIGSRESICARNIQLRRAMDADIDGRIAVAGYSPVATGAQCFDFTNSRTVQIGFVSLLNLEGKQPFQVHKIGNIVWLNQASVGQELILPTLVALSGSNFYTMSNSVNLDQFLRYIKIDAENGNVLKEVQGDSMITSATSLHDLRIDRSTQDLYHKFVIQSTQLSFSQQRSIILKLNSNLQVQWIKTLYSASVSQIYNVFDINVDSSDIWQLSRFYTTASNQAYSVQKASKVNYAFSQEIIIPFSASIPTNQVGRIQLDSNYSNWYYASCYDTTGNIQLGIGSTSTNTLTKNYLLNVIVLDLQLYIASTTGNFIIIGRLLTSTNINYVTATKAGSNFIIGLNSLAYYTTKIRIILVGIKDDAYSTSASCINFTNPSYTTLTDLGTSGYSTSATALYTADNEAYAFNAVASSTYSLQSGSSKYPDIAVTRDTTTNQYCDLPLIVTPSYLLVDTSPATFTITDIRDCSGSIYTFTAVSWPGGGASPEVTVNTVAQTITITIGSQAIRETLGNFYAIKLTVVNDNIIRYAYISVENKFALTSSARDPATPNHDVSTCSMPIYPLLYGGITLPALDVSVRNFNIDQYGNFIIAGVSQTQPFNTLGDTKQRGFISYMDQRGTPYWTYTLISFVNANAATDCKFATQSGSFIYGLCVMPNEYFKSTTLNQPVIIKLNIRYGNPSWFRLLPQDDTNPSTQTPVSMEILASNKILVLYKYTWTGNAYQNFVAFKFDETTFKADYFNFYPADIATTYAMHFLIDNTGTYFYQFRHQITNKELVSQIRITDGVLEKKALINTIMSEDKNMQQTFYGTDKIILPIISSGAQDTFQFYVLNKIDLTRVTAIQLLFPSTTNLVTASITTDSSLNIYITLGQSQIYFAKLDSTFAFTEHRMWKGDFTDAYWPVNSRVHGSNQFHAFMGRYSLAGSFQTLIFKIGNWSQTCFDVPILLPATTTFFPTISTINTNPTITAVSNVEVAAPLPTDNLPLLALIQSHKWTSLSFNPTGQYVWGLQQMNGKYRRYPFDSQICSPLETVAALKDSNTYELIQSTGNKSITFTTDFKNCQDRPTTALVLNPYTDTQTMKQPTMMTASNNVLNVITNAITQPISHNIKLRYQDTTYTAFFWDNYVHFQQCQKIN